MDFAWLYLFETRSDAFSGFSILSFASIPDFEQMAAKNECFPEVDENHNFWGRGSIVR